jgi:hypothetical protein
VARLTLSTRNAGGIAANFVAADRRAQAAVKKVVRRNGVQLHEKAYAACPVDTGFMRSQLRVGFSENGYAYEVGWLEGDFAEAGLAFYPVYVIFGTRRQAANDFFFPLRDRQLAQFKSELGTELRAAYARRGAA